MKCKNCGFKNEKSADFCQECGAPLRKSPALKIIIIAIFAVVIIGAVAAVVLLRGDGDDVREETAQTFDVENIEQDEDEDIETASPPEFQNIYASSTLESQYGNDYEPLNVVDDDVATAWVEGAAGSGEGQWIEFDALEQQNISGMRIVNGYCKDKDTYVKNSRVKELKVIFGDGSVENIVLDDEYGLYQDFEFGRTVKTASVELRIVSVYNGTEYDDTCISEVEFY